MLKVLLVLHIIYPYLHLFCTLCVFAYINKHTSVAVWCKCVCVCVYLYTRTHTFVFNCGLMQDKTFSNNALHFLFFLFSFLPAACVAIRKRKISLRHLPQCTSHWGVCAFFSLYALVFFFFFFFKAGTYFIFFIFFVTSSQISSPLCRTCRKKKKEKRKKSKPDHTTPAPSVQPSMRPLQFLPSDHLL